MNYWSLLYIFLLVSLGYFFFFWCLINSLENHMSEVYRLKQIVPQPKTEQFHQQAAFTENKEKSFCIVTMAFLGEGETEEIKREF